MADDEPSLTSVILDAENRRDAIAAILAHMVVEGMLSLEAAAEVREGIELRH